MKFAILHLSIHCNQVGDETMQISMLLLDDHFNIEHEYITSFRPFIADHHSDGHTNKQEEEKWVAALELQQVMMELVPLLHDAVLIGHDVAFAYSFLCRALERTGYLPFVGHLLDSNELLRILFPALASFQLDAAVCELKLDEVQQPQSQVYMIRSIFLHCLQKLDQLPLLTLQRMVDIFAALEERDIKWLLHTKLTERLALAEEEAEGYYPFRQFLFKQTDWTDRCTAAHTAENPLQDVPFQQFLAQVKADLANRFTHYEQRTAQEQMYNEVMTCFEQEKHLLIEAGTGTGKSLGYLLPAIYYSIAQQKKIIISTHTINLQEQLRQRDIPLLRQMISFPFKVSVLKGRNHYLCLRKFEHKINHPTFIHAAWEERMMAAQMITWLSQTEHGEQEELHFGSTGVDFWATVSSDSDSCLHRACPWFRRCFYHRAKHEASDADLVITNHSLLFTDIIADNRLLPPYEHLIVDEAHHFEATASKHLGVQIHYFSLPKLLTRLVADKHQGALRLLQHRLRLLHTEAAADMIQIIDQFMIQLIDIQQHWEWIYELLYELLPVTNELGRVTWRFYENKDLHIWSKIEPLEQHIVTHLQTMDSCSHKRICESFMDDDIQGAMVDVFGLLKNIQQIVMQFRLIMQKNNDETVYWMEGNAQHKHRSLQLYAVPVMSGHLLQKYFYETKKSIVFTSATLSVNQSFHFAIEQLGLQAEQKERRLHTVILPSPFHYRKQALVLIPRDFPRMKGEIGTTFYQTLTESLREVVTITAGRMLILFTSYQMLRDIYTRLKDILQHQGIRVLAQGINGGNRSQLIAQFKAQANTVLLGTNSFWEGIDIPGDALTCLIIIRLPFQPPNHPLTQAKCERLQRLQQSSFQAYMVPQAVIRFKQGFGRLVRTAQDKGIVIIYDTRVLDENYGKCFLYSLPGPKIEHMAMKHLGSRIYTWLQSNPYNKGE